MEANEAAEMMETERETDLFKRRAAIVIAFFAAMLAITSLGGQNATKEALNANIEASDLYNFYQAKNERQTSYALAADAFQLAFANDPNLSPEAKGAISAKMDEYRRTVARYESDPSTQEGKKELLAKAKEQDAKRDKALRQDPYFDYAEALLQIAIVMISVAIVAEQGWLSYVGGVFGLIGCFLMLDGYLMFLAVPFLS